MKSIGEEKKGKLAYKAALSDLAQFAHRMKHVHVTLNKQLRAAITKEEEYN